MSVPLLDTSKARSRDPSYGSTETGHCAKIIELGQLHMDATKEIYFNPPKQDTMDADRCSRLSDCCLSCLTCSQKVTQVGCQLLCIMPCCCLETFLDCLSDAFSRCCQSPDGDNQPINLHPFAALPDDSQ